ncbi:unnamed protein product [Cyprideis torosa]|uniref:Uncharacterized protein n=1 Tax=Cyprideis torosa TaxID=163714 RepID=A0A7R8WAX1_9CRUS|nr:unnamed protein product [Cyprideis torosa]CAG0891522.1 unnamed protein product [Cyprideis torosa]
MFSFSIFLYLQYTALLRLPDAMPHKEKTRHVQKLIDLLDLTRCQHTIIGDTMNRGLSGGEKKRASIASELLTNPALMLLDEPTSGLDSSSATSIISTLRDFAKKGNKSVIVTVHQPSSQIFYMFDRILLLADGQAAYYGSADDVVHHFSQLGYQMALHYNPADFMMELVKGSTEAKQRLIADVANRKEQGHRLSSHRDGSLEGLREVEETLVPRKHSLPWLPPSAGTDFDPGFDGSLPATPPGDGPLHSDVRCFDVCPKKVLEQVAPDAKELPVLEETTGNGRSSSPSTLVKIDRDEPDSGRASWTEECGSHTSGSSSVLSHHSPHHFTRRRSSRLKRQMTKWPTSFWTQLKVKHPLILF